MAEDERLTASRIELYSAQQVAEMIGMSRNFVLDHARELGGIPLGSPENRRTGRWKFTREGIEKFLFKSGRIGKHIA